jgi:hypothetical protein
MRRAIDLGARFPRPLMNFSGDRGIWGDRIFRAIGIWGFGGFLIWGIFDLGRSRDFF